MELPPEFAHLSVPTIGDPFECFDPLIVQPARCKCSPDNKPFLISGLNMMVKCARCGNAYVIQTVAFDRASGQHVSSSVALVIAPKGGTN